MGYLVFLVAALLLAVGALPWFGGGDDLPERIGLTILLWFLILIGASWGLAAVGLLSEKALWICTGFFALTGTILLFPRWKALASAHRSLAITPLAAWMLAAFGLSILYIIIRGSLVPPTEFDALSYHFPKAVEISRAHSVRFIPSGDFRIPYFPWNYELLLADGLLLAHGDQQSYWIGLLATLGFCAYVGAIIKKAWPQATGSETLLSILLVASTPILILHAGAYKNDILFSFFLLSAIHWITLWSRNGRIREWLLALLSVALGFGTKSTALFLLPIAGAMAWRFRSKWPFARPLRPWKLVLGVAGLGLLLALTGSAWPIMNKIWCGHLLGETAMVGGVDGYQSNAVPHYAGFSNLWRFPLLAILRPFSSNSLGVWVFWKHQYWYWPSYNGIYGHFGWLCSALLLLLPVGILRHRIDLGEVVRYRVTLTWITLGFITLSLPQSYRVDGMFCTFPRYLFCIPVLVALWTLPPFLLWLREKGSHIAISGIGVGLIVYFLSQSYLCFANDTSKPFSFVEQCLRWPDRRPDVGVESFVDQVAGPMDSVAFDSGYGSFVYPLYGATATRPLIYLPRGSGGVQIPPGIQWVVIDRKWNVGWSHPGATSTAEFFLPIKRGASQEDLALVSQMIRDPNFVMIYSNPIHNQWAFIARSLMDQRKR